MNARGGYKAYELAQATKNDTKAQRYLKESVNITNQFQIKGEYNVGCTKNFV